MGIFINSNIAALNAQRRLGQSTAQLSQSYTRLSSGLRINAASDDAAGLAISAGLNADARVYQQGIRNINDALGVLNVADSALSELSHIVTRQLELAEQAANGVQSLTQRQAMDQEADALTNEFNRIVATTSYNGIQLLDLSNPTFRTQAGYGTAESLTFALGASFARTVSNGVYTSVQTLAGGAPRATDVDSMDLNGDGKLDLVLSQDGGFDRIEVMLGCGNGLFASAQTYATGSSPEEVRLGDINKDGRADVVTINSGDNSYSILLGNGNGTFLAATSYSPGLSSPGSIELRDLNNDGFLDLVAGNGGSNTVSVLLGQAGGTFKAATSYTAVGATTVTDVELGDVNGDGILDIATSNGNSGDTSIFLGTGNGSFSASRSYVTDSLARSLTLADLDDNGILDLIVSTGGTDKFNVLLGNGDGTFSARVSYGGITDSASHTYVKDLNGDGLPDVIQTDNGHSTFKLFYGNGNGSFRAPISVSAATSPSAMVFSDLNGDDVTDLVVVTHNGGTGYSILSGTTTTVLAPELDFNSQQGALDALTFLKSSLNHITLERGNIGAMQSRLSVAANVLGQRRQNYIEAASGILDVDVATEAANLVRSKILQQAGAAILGQANQAPALALVLLGGGRR